MTTSCQPSITAFPMASVGVRSPRFCAWHYAMSARSVCKSPFTTLPSIQIEAPGAASRTRSLRRFARSRAHTPTNLGGRRHLARSRCEDQFAMMKAHARVCRLVERHHVLVRIAPVRVRVYGRKDGHADFRGDL